MAVNEDLGNRRVQSRLRGRVTAYVNIGLCLIGAVFIVIGVLRSTLLLYVGCAFIGAAIGGFIRSRLPIHQMHMVPPHLHMVYRHELQQNIQAALQDGVQTFLVVNGQRPMGADQKTIEKNSIVTTYKPSLSTPVRKSESVDRISVISSFTDVDEPSCIICLLSFKKGQEIRQLKCQHIFHIDCIDRWLKINRLCPTCRIDLTGTVPEKAVNELPGTSSLSTRTLSSPAPAVLSLGGGYPDISILDLTQSQTTVNFASQTSVVSEQPNTNLVINALEQVTRTDHFISDDAAETVSENADDLNNPVVTISIDEPSNCSCQEEVEVHSASKIEASPAGPSRDCDSNNELVAENRPSCSTCVETDDSNGENESTGNVSHTPYATCGSEIRSTMITFSMPHNATPWV